MDSSTHQLLPDLESGATVLDALRYDCGLGRLGSSFKPLISNTGGRYGRRI